MRLFSPQRARYLIIGCLCAISNNVIMIAGDRAGESYLVMTLVSFLILTPTACALHTRFTFSEKFSISRLLIYVSGAALGLPLSLLSMTILCKVAKLPVVIAAPMTTIIMFVWNYASAYFSIVVRLRRVKGDREQTLA